MKSKGISGDGSSSRSKMWIKSETCVQCLLELMLLLDKWDSSRVTQVLLKFRNKFWISFGGEAWRRLCKKLLDKPVYFYVLYPYLSIYWFFPHFHLPIPVCIFFSSTPEMPFSFHPGCQASCTWIPNSVVISPSIPCPSPNVTNVYWDISSSPQSCCCLS